VKIKRKWLKTNLIIINYGEIIKYKIKILDEYKIRNQIKNITLDLKKAMVNKQIIFKII
jgi:hypothetical protein